MIYHHMAKCNFKIQELVETNPEFVWKDLIEGPPLYIQGYFDALRKSNEGDDDYEYGKHYRMLDAQNNLLLLKTESIKVSEAEWGYNI